MVSAQAYREPNRCLACFWSVSFWYRTASFKKCKNLFPQTSMRFHSAMATFEPQKHIIGRRVWTENILLVSGPLVWNRLRCKICSRTKLPLVNTLLGDHCCVNISAPVYHFPQGVLEFVIVENNSITPNYLYLFMVAWSECNPVAFMSSSLGSAMNEMFFFVIVCLEHERVFNYWTFCFCDLIVFYNVSVTATI